MAIKNNINRALALLIVAFVAALGSCQSAWAKNAHQSHNGACARSTTSINKGLGDLKFNGVLGSFGKSLGFSKVNGSLLYQMRTRMTVGKIAKAVTTKNEGCNGKGGTFGAGKRRLYKGEKVAFAIPSEYSVDQVCPLGRTKGCKPVTVEEDVVLPVSCWNRNRNSKDKRGKKIVIMVTIWIHKSPDKKPVSPVVTPPSTGSISQGDKVTLTAEQECAARGSNWRWNTVTVKCEININSSTGGDSGTTGNGSNTGGSTGGGGSQGGGGSGAGGNVGTCSNQGSTGGGGGTTGSGSGGTSGGVSNGGVTCNITCSNVNSPGGVVNCDTTPTPVDLCPNLSGTQQTVPGGMVVTWTGDCVANTCPPGEIRVTKSGANDSWGWIASGQAGLEYQVWYSAGLAFWGNQNQIPAGATPGTPACTKSAPSSSGGGGAPTSP